MVTLLVLTCAQDVCLTRNLLLRIGEVGGWQHFGRVFLHLDNDLSQRAAEAILRPLIPLPTSDIIIHRSPIFDDWNTRRAASALSIYQRVSELGSDFVRLDSDLYIARPDFFTKLLAGGPGIAGKVMPFSLPARVGGKQLTFVQGGATLWGREARAFVGGLKEEDIEDFRRDYRKVVEVPSDEETAKQDYFFTSTEDVVISGVFATLAGVPRSPIECLQVSPYDVLEDYQSPTKTYDDYLHAFRESGASAYHFEGGHDKRKEVMTKMLQTVYRQLDGDE